MGRDDLHAIYSQRGVAPVRGAEKNGEEKKKKVYIKKRGDVLYPLL